MRKSKIEAELLGAVKDFKAKKGEDRQDYLERLMRAVAATKNSVWNKLSKQAQDWNNAAAQCYKDEYEIDEFPDQEELAPPKPARVSPVAEDQPSLVPEEPADAPAEKELVFADEHTNGHQHASQPSKNGAHKTKHKEPEFTGNQGTKKVSACHIIKRMVVRKPSATVAEISEKLDAHGLRVTDITIATLRSSTRDTLRVLNEEGAGHFKL